MRTRPGLDGCRYPPFRTGEYKLPISNRWRLIGDTGPGKWFCDNDQRFEITSNGTVRVGKFGMTFERKLNSDIVEEIK